MTTSKLFAAATTIAIAFFVVGYSTYPYIHSDIDTTESSLVEIQQQSNTNKTPMVSTLHNVNVKSSQSNSQSNSQDIEHNRSLVSIEDDSGELLNEQADTVKEMDARNINSSPDLNAEFLEEQTNFDQWKRNNKAEVLEKMQAVLPDSIRDFFTKKIEESDFFSDVEATQDAISDEEWSQILETKIRDFITLHKLGNQVEIIDLDCVQLTCRISGISSAQHAWQNMYSEMFFSFVKEGFLPNEANKKTGVSYIVDETTYFYSQLAFLKQ